LRRRQSPRGPSRQDARKFSLKDIHAEIVPDDEATPLYLGEYVKSEIAKWATPIKASGVTIE
jgi:hypothetical protein